MGRRRLPDLYCAPFPLYALGIDHKRNLLITAGGGGASKTGIKNAVLFLQLEWISGCLSASLLHSHGTETRATMNMALAGDVLAAGQDANCHILRFIKNAKSTEAGSNERGSRRRKTSKSGADGNGQTKNETPEITVQTLHVVQTDVSPDGLQKAVCFNSHKTHLLTGGADGRLRVWEFPGMKKLLDFEAHSGEIEDIAAGPDSQVVTVGQDFRCCVWEADQLLTELRWNENLPHIPDKVYRYRACRFGSVPDQKETLCLYTVQIPYKRERRPPPCYLTKWDGRHFLPLHTQPCGNEVVSCMSVSDSGTFLGLGTVTGSVAIYISFSLQKLYYVEEAHGIVVTDVAFLPDVPKESDLLGGNEVALLSVAVDSRCKLHVVPNRKTFPLWLVLVLCGLLLVLVVFLLQHAFPGLL
ncbi:prolactin regulatory element-binding protein [Bombina bombina]|uniref:prolactin regulatory element-binding protein n=1 Tax=Bombina bombina TaxID=8345 RepID=UPI00235A6356|nr:prolactin regulatory element-binding protein [Bombina bombina]